MNDEESIKHDKSSCAPILVEINERSVKGVKQQASCIFNNIVNDAVAKERQLIIRSIGSNPIEAKLSKGFTLQYIIKDSSEKIGRVIIHHCRW